MRETIRQILRHLFERNDNWIFQEINDLPKTICKIAIVGALIFEGMLIINILGCGKTLFQFGTNEL
jgi:hypothetical protein